MDSSEEAKDRLTSSTMGWCLLSFWPFSSCVVRNISLTSRMRNMWSLYLLSRQGSAPLLFLLLSSSWEYLSTGDKLQLLSLEPTYLLPQVHTAKKNLYQDWNLDTYPWVTLCLTEVSQTVSHKSLVREMQSETARRHHFASFSLRKISDWQKLGRICHCGEQFVGILWCGGATCSMTQQVTLCVTLENASHSCWAIGRCSLEHCLL